MVGKPLRNRPQGFTLFELMLTVVVVGVLVVALWPVYASDGPRAASSRCLSDTKQSLLAFNIYANDNNDRMPLAAQWGDVIQAYARNEEILKDVEGIPNGTFGRAYRKSASGLLTTSIKKPEGFLLLFDSTLLARNAVSRPETLPHPGRHEGKDTVGYLDGHARAVTMP